MVNDYGQLMFKGARSDLSCSNTAMMVIRSFRIFVMTLALRARRRLPEQGTDPEGGDRFEQHGAGRND